MKKPVHLLLQNFGIAALRKGAKGGGDERINPGGEPRSHLLKEGRGGGDGFRLRSKANNPRHPKLKLRGKLIWESRQGCSSPSPQLTASRVHPKKREEKFPLRV